MRAVWPDTNKKVRFAQSDLRYLLCFGTILHAFSFQYSFK
jgi:hypothetical protein